ncbi:MAG TPA: calcium-binding protein, partial [Solirubrobacterales bacterium]|nr:calcium-binding protein [Solirubrobacterales bacterium]
MPTRLVLAVLIVLAAPATASAALVQTHIRTLQDDTGKGCTVVPEACTIVTLVFTADPGDANRVQLTRDGSDVLVRDTGAKNLRAAGPGCKQENPNRVRCSPPEGPSTGIAFMDVELGDMDDVLDDEVTGTTALEAEGGPGDDQLSGGEGFDVLGGGAGADRLEGGPFVDHLGDGVGGEGVEPDVMDGGDGADRVSYARRTARVTVNLAAAGPNAGQQGEADTLTSVELVWGGRGPDVLRAGSAGVVFSGRGGNDQLVGGFGRDELEGDSGNDKLDGSFGRDRLWGGTGNDRLRGGCDGDRVSGEEGRDRFFDADGSRDVLSGGA